MNILHGKPNIERHFVRYLKFINQEEILKAYYLQYKKYDDLGY